MIYDHTPAKSKIDHSVDSRRYSMLKLNKKNNTIGASQVRNSTTSSSDIPTLSQKQRGVVVWCALGDLNIRKRSENGAAPLARSPWLRPRARGRLAAQAT